MRSDFFQALIKTGVVVMVVLIGALAMVWVFDSDRNHNSDARAQRISCLNNLKQVGLAFHQWALDHDDQFPFNVSTNAGGTLEFCAVGENGFDRNAALHLQVMSNELNTPMILVCPDDRSTWGALGFENLRPSNLTYQIRSGSNLGEQSRREILVVCPIDNNVLYCDGTVSAGKGSKH